MLNAKPVYGFEELFGIAAELTLARTELKYEIFILGIICITFISGFHCRAAQENLHRVVLSNGGLVFTAGMDSFRYGFELDGKTVVGMDGRAGVMLAGSPINAHPEQRCLLSHCVFQGTGLAGEKIRITVDLTKHHAILLAELEETGDEVRFVTAGAAPAFGLADHAVEQKRFSTLKDKQFSTDVTVLQMIRFSLDRDKPDW